MASLAVYKFGEVDILTRLDDYGYCPTTGKHGKQFNEEGYSILPYEDAQRFADDEVLNLLDVIISEPV